MLASLYIADLALIRRLSVDFSNGFTVFTGETGAGKSLVLDSLQLFLSSKSGKELVRHGADKLEVSLFFDRISPESYPFLEEYCSREELEEGITLSRIVYADGRSKNQFNGRSLPFSKLSSLAKILLTVYGQHDSGGLLEEKNHRAYLDAALEKKDPNVIREFQSAFEVWHETKKRLEALEQENYDKQTLALWDFQMKEIAKVRPKPGEEDELEEKLKRITASENYRKNLHTASRALHGGEKGKGAVFLVEAAARKLSLLGEKYLPLSQELENMGQRLSEVEKDLSFALADLETDAGEETIDAIHKRLDLLYRLKQKYGKTIEEIIALYEELKQKKDLTLTRKDDIRKAMAQWEEETKVLKEKAEKLSAARIAFAKELEERIHKTLAFLDMPKMRFQVNFTPLDAISPLGGEKISFAISANTGEGTKPLSQVASGGELSRIMLALGLHLNETYDAQTFIFDEIDTGISGSTAQKIGICLKSLAKKKQIFCVTHSAQVASLCDNHFLVSKKETCDRTETTVTLLDREASLWETARLLGGKEISQEAKNAAEELQKEGKREFEKSPYRFRD